MGPCGVHFFFLVNTSLCKVQIALFDVRERTEDVFFDHLHDLIKVGDYYANHVFLVLEHLLQLSDGVQAFSLQISYVKMISFQ